MNNQSSADYERSKRLLDLLLGSTGLVGAIVAGVALVPLIRYRSPGAPAIFRQTHRRFESNGLPSPPEDTCCCCPVPLH